MRPIQLCVAVLALTSQVRAEDDLGQCQERAFDKADPTPVRVIDYTRDARGRRARQTIRLKGGMTLVTDYAYDKRGRLATERSEGSSRTVHEYDRKTGKLERTLDYSSAKPRVPRSTWTMTYHTNGQLARVTMREGTSGPITIDKHYTYDAAGRMESVNLDAGNTVETHHYDDKGLRLRTDSVSSGRTTTFFYRYDTKRRLIEQANPGGRIEYLYDCASPTAKRSRRDP